MGRSRTRGRLEDDADAAIGEGTDAIVGERWPQHVPARPFESLAIPAIDDGGGMQLPAGVDPCGEHGEFHTFATTGPMFPAPIHVCVGELVERDGFVFTDLSPAQQPVATRA